ncbi:MAG: envelope biogenesis factor ElyC [Deltaproteobacteria bacterium]|nr:envelope biogenesis factor ElyC [Deltaproteobacteria bacterium]
MFLFKKIIPLFFFPVPLCLELLLVGLALLWFTRRQRAGKILVSAGAGLLLILGYAFVPDLMLRPLEQQYPPVADLTAGQAGPKEVQAIKYIVVLGGGHTSDPKLPVTSQIGSESLCRVLEGVRLYQAGPGRKLILSGGGVFDPVPESQTMSRIALIMGVNPADIIQESISQDTEEEARLIKPMVGRENFFLVTSASHLPRAMAMFIKLGLAPEPAPVGHLVRQAPHWSPDDFFPDSGGLHHTKIALYEYLGLAWARLRGVI